MFFRSFNIVILGVFLFGCAPGVSTFSLFQPSTEGPPVVLPPDIGPPPKIKKLCETEEEASLESIELKSIYTYSKLNDDEIGASVPTFRRAGDGGAFFTTNRHGIVSDPIPGTNKIDEFLHRIDFDGEEVLTNIFEADTFTADVFVSEGNIAKLAVKDDVAQVTFASNGGGVVRTTRFPLISELGSQAILGKDVDGRVFFSIEGVSFGDDRKSFLFELNQSTGETRYLFQTDLPLNRGKTNPNGRVLAFSRDNEEHEISIINTATVPAQESESIVSVNFAEHFATLPEINDETVVTSLRVHSVRSGGVFIGFSTRFPADGDAQETRVGLAVVEIATGNITRSMFSENFVNSNGFSPRTVLVNNKYFEHLTNVRRIEGRKIGIELSDGENKREIEFDLSESLFTGGFDFNEPDVVDFQKWIIDGETYLHFQTSALVEGFRAERSQIIQVMSKEDPAVAASSVPTEMPQLISETCLYRVNDDGEFELNELEVSEFMPAFELWSDGAIKKRYIHVPEGERVRTTNMNSWEFPVGTRVWKEFKKDGKLIETRMMIKTQTSQGNDSWIRTSYVWNDDETEAERLDAGRADVKETGLDIPSVEQCMECHRGSEDGLLGFDAFNMGGSFESRIFLSELISNEKFDVDSISDIPQIEGNSIEVSAIGYLHVNCGGCHNPKGQFVPTNFAMKYDLNSTSIPESNVVTSLIEAFKVLPGEEPTSSPIIVRLEGNTMPPLGVEIVDTAGAQILKDWIGTLPAPE